MPSAAEAADLRRFGQFARGFYADTNIDRRTCQRVTPLEVLHLAHSRTGTLSKLKTRAVDLLQRTSN
jgi:hypothetical protein